MEGSLDRPYRCGACGWYGPEKEVDLQWEILLEEEDEGYYTLLCPRCGCHVEKDYR